MISNVNVQYRVGESIHVSWKWESDSTDKIPSCKIFILGFPTEEVLKEGLFMNNEILRYIDEKYVKVLDEAGDAAVVQNLQWYVDTHPGSNTIQQVVEQTNTDREDRPFSVDNASMSNYYLVVVCDDQRNYMDVVTCDRALEIRYEVLEKEETGFFKKLFARGNTHQEGTQIEIGSGDKRRKMIVYEDGVRAVLPQGTTVFYLPEGIDPSTVKIQYLSSMIGKN